MSIKKLELTVTGFETELNEFLNLCRAIQLLCTNGSSRELCVTVDGDGSANLNFYIEGERLPCDDLSVDSLPKFSIGE